MLLPGGVAVTLLRAGDGVHFPQRGACVRCHYEVRIKLDGVLTAAVDSSRARGAPHVARVGTGQLVPGLDALLPQLSKGAHVSVEVPPGRAYGATGYPPIVPPGSVVVYDLELLAVE